MKLFIGQVGQELDQQSQDQEVRERERDMEMSLIYILIHHIFIDFIFFLS